MNGFTYDALSLSEGSMPRTPSPGSSSSSPEVNSFQLSPSPYDSLFAPTTSNIPPAYVHADTYQPSVDVAPAWQNMMHGGPILHATPGPAGRTTLLQELYDHELPPEHLSHAHSQGPPHHHDSYLAHSAEPHYGGGGEWPAVTPPSSSHGLPPSPHALPSMRVPHDNMVRRNTFPYVRHDQEQSAQFQHQQPPPHYIEHPPLMAPFGGRQEMVYGEPLPMSNGHHHMPLSAEPSALHGPRMEEGYPSMHHHHHPSPHSGYREFDDSGVKLEDNGPVMIQQPFYRPPSSGGMPMQYLSPHAGIPIQHTDDAASKETQYLRRRCFNCHTTEPPSWRRSTLNPGKIVCNKCGLYERTHLRPRPLRFDELRAGNKARKAAAKTAASSPKARPAKKSNSLEEGGISRRASVSSNASSVGGTSSDWDDGGGIPQ
jgi:GATA-binding protein